MERANRVELLPDPVTSGNSAGGTEAAEAKIRNAAKLEADAKKALSQDLDLHPRVAKAKTSTEKAREMASLKRQRADRSAEVVKDPSKDPLIKKRLSAKEKQAAELAKAEEAMKPETVLNEGKAALQRDRDIARAQAPDSIGAVVRKALPIPSREIMRNPEARMAWYSQLEKLMKVNPKFDRHRAIIQSAALNDDPDRAYRLATQLWEMLRREEGTEE